MILAIDVGNTNIVTGCFIDDKISFTERLSTNENATAIEYAISFKNILELYNIDEKTIDGAIISSVVPSINNSISTAIEKIIGKKPLIVGPGIKNGLSIKIDNPAQLGSDLVVGSVAAISEYPAPIVIFDMGTATTVCVIDSEKNYIGGMILPGIMVSVNSLVESTSQLPKIGLDKPKKLIGTNTVDAMKSGIMYSTACGMDGLIKKIEEELGQSVTAIATGGLSKAIIPLCEKHIIQDDELLLKGLRIIYNKNNK